MSPHGCPKMSAKLCNRNAEESFPVLSLKSWEQKPPNPLLIQDKNVLQPSLCLPQEWARDAQRRHAGHGPREVREHTRQEQCVARRDRGGGSGAPRLGGRR